MLEFVERTYGTFKRQQSSLSGAIGGIDIVIQNIPQCKASAWLGLAMRYGTVLWITLPICVCVRVRVRKTERRIRSSAASAIEFFHHLAQTKRCIASYLSHRVKTLCIFTIRLDKGT